MTWEFGHVTAAAGEFHASEPQANEVWTVMVNREAIVLGSRQGPDVLRGAAVEAERIEVASRRSGGGIVHLVPGEHLWIDITISRGHSQWTDDVVRSMTWLGEVWERALAEVGVSCAVHRSRLAADPLGELVCFASLGPGEVVDAHGAKLVGISQRRTRDTARFQCTVLTAWQPQRLASFLAVPLTPTDQAELRARVAVVEQPVAAIEAAVHRTLMSL
jgi:lipoate-protein ligase A